MVIADYRVFAARICADSACTRALWHVPDKWDAADVLTQVASHTKTSPIGYGIMVIPSGFLP